MLFALITIAFTSLVFTSRAIAQTEIPEVKYKNLNELKNQTTFFLTCATTSGTPTVQFAFHYTLISMTPPGTGATLAVFFPGEGLSVYDMPQVTFNPGMPGTYPWILTYPDANTMDVVAYAGTIPAGAVHFTLQNGTAGKFKMNLKFSTDQTFEWNLRCSATNYYKKLD